MDETITGTVIRVNGPFVNGSYVIEVVTETGDEHAVHLSAEQYRELAESEDVPRDNTLLN